MEKGVEADMPTAYGHFRIIPFLQKSNGLEHVALIKGEWEEDEPVLVRMHSSCATGDIFGSQRCDCGEQLHKSMQLIDEADFDSICLECARRKIKTAPETYEEKQRSVASLVRLGHTYDSAKRAVSLLTNGDDLI